ncbi:hypothetical protein GLAREA_11741 [Glarea lozoyensis ATCC 20868]|uniref:Uncharacterized protein n=1 Tax=Glarea lozoyensis (strain ATCC 20868 / MF5171) TaxID=1116229 RepID=S3CH05_GLAL2|nr:uncharacterized protein GLAREA_11741 [Glarea lozoyensis ATCC 20868]EPE25160.1 hypothetical protein GLAREA_11741 [Glarea lozoyensis ATCC 20868]
MQPLSIILAVCLGLAVAAPVNSREALPDMVADVSVPDDLLRRDVVADVTVPVDLLKREEVIDVDIPSDLL